MWTTCIDIIFIILLVYIGIIDIKTHTIKNRYCIAAYTIALISAITKGYSLGEIALYTIPLPVFLLTVGLTYERITRTKRKPDEYPYGIGGGDIKIAPAVGLFTGDLIISALLVSFTAAAVVGLFICKEREVPLAPYFGVGCLTVFIVGMLLH